MAKKKKNEKIAISISKKEMTEYMLLTSQNRKYLIKLGALIHVIRLGDGGNMKRTNIIDVRPRLQRGYLTIKGDPYLESLGESFKFFIHADENHNEYKDMFESLIKDGIEKGIFYIKKEESKVEYYHVAIPDKK